MGHFTAPQLLIQARINSPNLVKAHLLSKRDTLILFQGNLAVRIQPSRPPNMVPVRMKSHLEGILARNLGKNNFPKVWQIISRVEDDPIKTKIRQVGCQNTAWQASKVSNFNNVLLLIQRQDSQDSIKSTSNSSSSF